MNHLNINLIKFVRYSSMIYPSAIYTQILRRNCENKDKIDQYLNAITMKTSKESNSGGEEELLQYDVNTSEHHTEGKLLQSIRSIDGNLRSSRSHYLMLRNECLNHLCMKEATGQFSRAFVEILNTYDREFVRENEKLVLFLTVHLIQWRRKRQNLDVFLTDLCDLYKHYMTSKLSKQINLTTKTILRDILKTHGSSAVVKIAESFKRVCEETGDYELLYILWKELFESEWYSDQQFSHQLIEMTEVRKILASRTRNLCIEYFNNNETEFANKLLQIFLRFHMRANTEQTLEFYLAYECFQQNVSAATQVVKLCIALNISLSESENRKYLNLLLKRPKQQKQQQQKEEEKREPTKISVEKYKFQF